MGCTLGGHWSLYRRCLNPRVVGGIFQCPAAKKGPGRFADGWA